MNLQKMNRFTQVNSKRLQRNSSAQFPTVFLVLVTCVIIGFITYQHIVKRISIRPELEYDVIDLGPSPAVEPHSINDAGVVVGMSDVADGRTRHAFYQNADKRHDLGTLGRWSTAKSINELGDIVGYSSNKRDEVRGFVYRKGTLHQLSTLGNSHSTYVYAINSNGWIVGADQNAHGDLQACLWRNTKITLLGTLGGRSSVATDINERGQVIGHSAIGPSSTPIRAFLWEKARMRDLGSLGGDSSEAAAINDDGQIVGRANAADGNMYPFLYRNGKITPIPIGKRYAGGRGNAINNKGQVVGYMYANPSPLLNRLFPNLFEEQRTRAFLYTGGKTYELDTLLPEDSGWVLIDARDINSSGRIVGTGLFMGQEHAFLLIPRR